jgi:hypothetical protein
MVAASSHVPLYPWWRVPKGFMAQGYLLFLQEQIKDIIIIRLPRNLPSSGTE